MRSVLVDANVLIGYLDPDDGLHPGSVEGLAAATGNLVTTWPAVTEAAHLLGREFPAGRDALLSMIEDGSLRLVRLDAGDYLADLASVVKEEEVAEEVAEAGAEAGKETGKK